MTNKTTFYPPVIDEGGAIRRRLASLHRKTRVQKCRLASLALSAGLSVIEKQMEGLETGVLASSKTETEETKK